MPLGSARFYFFRISLGVFGFGDFFWVPWWCQLKLVGCGSGEKRRVLMFLHKEIEKADLKAYKYGLTTFPNKFLTIDKS